MPLPNELEALCREFDLGAQNVVVVVGAGVSYGATGEARATWRGLLEHGVDTLRANGTWDDEHARNSIGLINRAFTGSFDLDEVLIRAEKIAQAFGASDYAAWLAEAIGSLRAQPGRTDTLDAIRQLAQAGALILTTNYDDLLSEATELPPVTWQEPQEFLRVLNRDLKREGILHIHGHWRQPSSVVLGRTSYERILEANAQDLFKHAWMRSSWLYVGCGNGLDDPNVGRLLRWGDTTFGEAGRKHYFLALAKEADALAARTDRPANLVPIGYGDHAELPDYLRELTPRRRPQPFVELGPIHGPVRLEGTPPSDIPLPTWKELLDGDVPALAADRAVSDALGIHGWALVYDVASVGKTTLALRIAARSAHPEKGSNSPAFYLDLATTLNTDDDPSTDARVAVRRLAHTKALVVLDNAHAAPQLAREIWEWWHARPRAVRLLILATRIQYTAGAAGDDALAVIASHPGNPAIPVRPTTQDLRRILNCVVERIRGRGEVLDPPDGVLTTWHEAFGSAIGAFAAAVTGNHHRLARRDWDLPQSAAADWMYTQHLSKFKPDECENLICISAWATSAPELDVTEQALPHPGRTAALLRKGLVERRERGRDRYRSYALREPDWGELLLAAIEPAPDAEALVLDSVCRDARMVTYLGNRLQVRGDDERLARLWRRIETPETTTLFVDQIKAMSLSHIAGFLVFSARSSTLMERVLAALETDRPRLIERAFDELQSHGFAAFVEAVTTQKRMELADDLWAALEADPVRLARCALETSLSHLPSFIETASKHRRRALLDRLWSGLEADPARLAESAFETPLDHLATFIEIAAGNKRALLLDRLWSALEDDPVRLAECAFETPLDHLATFIQTAAAHKRTLLLDSLWAALETDVQRLAKRSLQVSLDQLASFIRTAFGQGRWSICAELWSAQEANFDALARRAFVAPLYQLVMFARMAWKMNPAVMIDLWAALAANPELLAESAFKSPLDQLSGFIALAKHRCIALVDSLWAAIVEDPSRLVARMSRTPLQYLAAFMDGAFSVGHPERAEHLWRLVEANHDQVLAGAPEASFISLASFVKTATTHKRTVLLDALWPKLEADLDRFAARAYGEPLGNLVPFMRAASNHGREALVDRLWSVLEADPTRLVAHAFADPPSLLVAFVRYAADQKRTTLLERLWTAFEHDSDRLAEHLRESPLHDVAAFIDRATERGGGALASRLWKALESDAEALQAAAAAQNGAALNGFLIRAPDSVSRTAVAKLDVADWMFRSGKQPYWGAPQLAVRLAALGRDDLAKAVRRRLLGSTDPRWFNAQYDAILDIAVLLGSVTDAEQHKVEAFVRQNCTSRWLAKQYTNASDDGLLADALVQIAVAQPPSILIRFRSPELTSRATFSIGPAARADDDELAKHIQLCGAAQLIGDRPSHGHFVTADFRRIARVPRETLPHRADTAGIESAQRNLWLGLRAVAGLAYTPLVVGQDVIDATLERWRTLERENTTAPKHKSHRLNKSMIRWLEECSVACRGVLLPSKEPLWVVAGFDRDAAAR